MGKILYGEILKIENIMDVIIPMKPFFSVNWQMAILHTFHPQVFASQVHFMSLSKTQVDYVDVLKHSVNIIFCLSLKKLLIFISIQYCRCMQFSLWCQSLIYNVNLHIMRGPILGSSFYKMILKREEFTFLITNK